MSQASQKVRERNERAILVKLLEAGNQGTTRADLANQLGLSAAAIASLVTGRIAPVLDRMQVSTGKTGPRPTALRLVPNAGCALGLDFGQTYMGAGMFDFHGHELDRRYLDIGAGADAAGAFSWMQSQVEEMVTDPSNVVGVGIGIAAPVKSASSSPLHDTFAMPDWIGRDPAHELRERLGWDCPFEVDNDANLGGVAELHWGAARGLSDAVFVKWTWGIGAGLIMGGEVQRGQGTAGELGHVNVELEEPDRKSPPPRCPTCGRHCLQSVASMPALLADAGIQGAYDRSRLHPAVEELLRTIRSGDPGPKRSLDRACRYLGQALGTVITLLSPQAVIIGGDLAAESYDLFAPELLAAMRDNSRGSAFRDVALRAGQQTGRASLLGAATWMLDEHLLDYLMRRAATRKKDA